MLGFCWLPQNPQLLEQGFLRNSAFLSFLKRKLLAYARMLKTSTANQAANNKIAEVFQSYYYFFENAISPSSQILGAARRGSTSLSLAAPAGERSLSETARSPRACSRAPLSPSPRCCSIVSLTQPFPTGNSNPGRKYLCVATLIPQTALAPFRTVSHRRQSIDDEITVVISVLHMADGLSPPQYSSLQGDDKASPLSQHRALPAGARGLRLLLPPCSALPLAPGEARPARGTDPAPARPRLAPPSHGQPQGTARGHRAPRCHLQEQPQHLERRPGWLQPEGFFSPLLQLVLQNLCLLLPPHVPSSGGQRAAEGRPRSAPQRGWVREGPHQHPRQRLEQSLYPASSPGLLPPPTRGTRALPPELARPRTRTPG